MMGTDQAGLCGCSKDFGSPGQVVSREGYDPTQVFTGTLWSRVRVKVGARNQLEGNGTGPGQQWGLRSLHL